MSVYVDTPVFLAVLNAGDRFHAHARQRRLSLVGCTSFESMRQSGLQQAFTFDVHFAEQGFEVLS